MFDRVIVDVHFVTKMLASSINKKWKKKCTLKLIPILKERSLFYNLVTKIS
jgi:hypothetical protein